MHSITERALVHLICLQFLAESANGGANGLFRQSITLAQLALHEAELPLVIHLEVLAARVTIRDICLKILSKFIVVFVALAHSLHIGVDLSQENLLLAVLVFPRLESALTVANHAPRTGTAREPFLIVKFAMGFRGCAAGGVRAAALVVPNACQLDAHRQLRGLRRCWNWLFL